MFDLYQAILFCHILLSLWFLWKITPFSQSHNFLSPIVWKIWIGFSILFVFLLTQLQIKSFFVQICLLYIPVGLTFFIHSLLTFIWKEQFLTQFEFFLNSLIARIKVGLGFRSGFKLAIQTMSSLHFQNHFMDILDSILLSKRMRKEYLFSPMRQMIEELQRTDHSHQCLKHLENLRHQLRTRTRFRRKVQVAILQVRIQSFLLLIIYTGLLFFILYRYGLKYPKILFTSSALFALGTIFLLQCGRKIKWTI